MLATVVVLTRETPPTSIRTQPQPTSSANSDVGGTEPTPPREGELERCGKSVSNSNVNVTTKEPGPADGFATREEAAARAFVTYFGGLPGMPVRLDASRPEGSLGYVVTADGSVALTEGSKSLASAQLDETRYGRFVLAGIEMCDDAIDEASTIWRINPVVSDAPEQLESACRAYFARLSEVFLTDAAGTEDPCSSFGSDNARNDW